MVEANISCPLTKDRVPHPLWLGKRMFFLQSTRISYFALLATSTYAVFLKNDLDQRHGSPQETGGAQWRGLRFGGSFLEMFFDSVTK